MTQVFVITRDRSGHIAWSGEMMDFIATRWCVQPTKDIAAAFGVTPRTISAKALGMGLPKQIVSKALRPRNAEWISVARNIAARHCVSLSEVLTGTKRPDVVRVRWLAWREMLDRYPGYSIAGLARVSGFDHTTILHGLKRLEGESTGNAKRARGTGRRPVLFGNYSEQRAA